MSSFDIYVWSGRASQLLELVGSGSCIYVSKLLIEAFCFGPSWISARLRQWDVGSDRVITEADRG
jgi:hypothetical protein